MPWASKWSRASVNACPVSSASTSITRAAKPGGVLMPVPTAVPPRGSSRTRGRTDSSRSAAYRTVAAYPPNSWPSITGVASMRWVRPDFTSPANSSALADRLRSRVARAGSRRSVTATADATWIEVGNVSLLDWLALTWSLGWTSVPALVARVAITSFMFMLELVPEPVWKTSTGNWSSWSPATTSRAAASIASACSLPITSSSPLTLAAAALIRARACTWSTSRPLPLIGKFSTARCVWARQRADSGTRTSPRESCSMRYPSLMGWTVPARRAASTARLAPADARRTPGSRRCRRPPPASPRGRPNGRRTR